ncbi:MAG: hypothetical protein IKS17_07695 [Firmicutes bacterium]|nr:hypothetical protein [Bacillota bacterium]
MKKRFLTGMAVLAAMLAFTGCGASENTADAPETDESAVQEQTQEQTEQTTEETSAEDTTEEEVSAEELKLGGIDKRKLFFFTRSQDTSDPNEAVLTKDEAKELVEMINAAPKEIGCYDGDNNVWFTDGDTRVYIYTLADGGTYANIYGAQQVSAVLTKEQKEKINELIKAHTDMDPMS